MPRIRISAKKIWTGDPARPWAKSITVDGARIAALDDTGAVDREIDGGEFACPAFIDSHAHLLLGGRSLSHAQLDGVSSREEFERVVRAKHESLPKHAWLQALGWDQSNWMGHASSDPTTRGRGISRGNATDGMPDHTWLACCGDRPAIAWRMDQHVCVVNRAALGLIAQRHDLSRDPAGGAIARDASGQPTGLLLEQAAWKLAVPCVCEPNQAELNQAARDGARHMRSHGIATVGSMEYSRDLVSTLSPLRHELNLRVRATLLDRTPPIDWSLGDCVKPDDALRIIGFKSFIDGTLGSRTARMLEPYCDAADSRGLFVELAESGRLSDWLREGLSRGWSMSMHAIGDAALRAALDAADSAEQSGIRARESLRIEHGQTAHSSDIARCRDRWLSMQPLHKYFDAAGAPERLGIDRMNRFFCFKEFHEAGARLAFGSDWPIVQPDCLLAMRTAITGSVAPAGADPPQSGGGRADTFVRPQSCVSPEIALKAFTSDAARCLRAGDTCGTLKAGMAADIISLDRDPLAVDWTRRAPNIRFTCVAGRVASEGS